MFDVFFQFLIESIYDPLKRRVGGIFAGIILSALSIIIIVGSCVLIVRFLW